MTKNHIKFWRIVIIFGIILSIVILTTYYNDSKDIVKIGIIDSVIDKKECGNNVIIKDFTNKDYMTITNHGKTILSIINYQL